MRQIARPPIHSRRTSDQDIVIPSVESEIVDLTSPRRIASGKLSYSDDQQMIQGYVDSPKRKVLPFPENDMPLRHDQGAKRLRLVHEQNVRSRPAEHIGHVAQGPSSSSQQLRGYVDARDLPHDEYINLTSSPLRAPPPLASGQYIEAPPRGVGGPTYLSPLSRYTTALREPNNTRPEYTVGAARPSLMATGMHNVSPSGQVFTQARNPRDDFTYR